MNIKQITKSVNIYDIRSIAYFNMANYYSDGSQSVDLVQIFADNWYNQ